MNTVKAALARIRCILLLGTLALLAGPVTADPVAGGPRPDLRLLIDISGSMKASDPENLRGPALELIVRLLPEGAKAGVWIFGEDVDVLVPHRVVDAAWREAARTAVAQIDNSGQRTNIPAALAAASYDLSSLDSRYRTSIVLLTDGKVDVSASPIANARAARQVLSETGPELGGIGIPVHTIALSDDADWNFLRHLAEQSAGLAEKAETAAEVTELFVQSLEMVAPTARVPLEGGSFSVDDSVDEFTALIFFAEEAASVALVSPDGTRSDSRESAGADTEWFVTRQFALVTVRDPAVGTWQLEAPRDARMRVTVIADLQLEVDPLPNSMPAGRIGEVGIRLRNEGQPLRDPEVLRLLSVTLDVTGPDGVTRSIDVSESYPVPDNGEYRVTVPAFEQGGRYQLMARVNGRTVQRELPMYVDVTASPESSAISTRPVDVPEASLMLPIITLAGVITLIGLLALWISRRRRRQRLALWKRRFEAAQPDADASVVSGLRADSEDSPAASRE